MRQSIERNLKVLEDMVALGTDAVHRQEQHLTVLRPLHHKDIIETAENVLIKLLLELEKAKLERRQAIAILHKMLSLEVMKKLADRGAILSKAIAADLPKILQDNHIAAQCAINYISLYQNWDDYLLTEQWNTATPPKTAGAALSVLDEWRHRPI